MTRIAIDAMGGDYAPKAIVEGAVWAAMEYNIPIELVGKLYDIERELDRIDQEGIVVEKGIFKPKKIKVNTKNLISNLLTQLKLLKWAKHQVKLSEKRKIHL